MKEAVFPDGPVVGVDEFWDWSVQQCDGRALLVMAGHPGYCCLDAVVFHVQKTVARGLVRWVLLDLVPGCATDLNNTYQLQCVHTCTVHRDSHII